MSIKIGDLYVEIYPKVNEAARKAAMASIANSIRGSANDAFDDVDNRSAQSSRNQINDRKRVESSNKKSIKSESTTWGQFWAQQEKNGKKSEGIFHKMATNFRTIGTLIRGLSVGALVIQGFSTLLTIIQGIAAAAPLIGAALVSLPAVIGGIVAEGLILKVAFKGIGKAISDGLNPAKAKQFAEDLKRLGPAAQTFVRAIVGGLKKLPNIQEIFFSQRSLLIARSNFSGFIAGISGNLKRLVAANGNLFGKIFGSFTSKTGTTQISKFLGNIAKLLRTITPGLTAVTQGFIALAASVSGQGAAHGKGINDALVKFGNFLKNIKVKQLFDAAIGAAKGFGKIIGNVIGIIGGIGRALGGSQALGAQFFKSLIGITKTIKDFVNSAAGQKFIKQLAGTLTALSKLVNGAILVGLKILSGFLAALYPSILQLAPVVLKLLQALIPLGPVLGQLAVQFIQLLIPALKIITPLITDLFEEIAKHPGLFQAMGAGLAVVALYLLIVNKRVGGMKTILTLALLIIVPLYNMGGGFKILAIALGIAAAAWKLYTLAQSASGIGLIITAVGLLAVAIFELATHWKQVWGAINSFFHSTAGKIIALILAITVPILALPIALLFLATHWKQTWHIILVAINVAKHGIQVAVEGMVHWFTVSVPHAAAVLWANMKRYWNAVVGAINIAKHGILVAVNGIVHWFTVSVPDAAKKLWANIVRYWNFIAQATGKLKNGVISLFTNILHFWTGPVYGGLRKLAGFAASIWRTMYGNVLRYFINPVKSAFTVCVNAIRTTWDKIRGFIMTPVNWVKDKVFNGILVPLWNHTVAVLPGVPTIKKLGAGGAVGPAPRNAGGGSRAALAEGGYVSPALLLGTNYGGSASTAGGRVRGLGGPVEDAIPAMLSHGEYVMTAATVRKLGTSFFDNLNAVGRNAPFAFGDLGHVVMTDRNFASGGPVVGKDGINYLKGGGKGIFGTIGSWLAGTAKVVGEGIAGKSSKAAPTLAWLRSIAGKVPYVLGSNGPNAFDCSSLVGAVWARLTGHNPNKRYFVTGESENSFLLGHGFKKGVKVKDSLLVGQNGEHTVGVLDGHRFEAAHTGTKMRFDDGATNALNMPQKYWMPAAGGGGLLSGALGFIQRLAGKGVEFMMTPLLAMLKKVPGVKGILGHWLGDLAASGDKKKGMIAGLGNLLGNSLTQKSNAAEAAAEAALAASDIGNGAPSNLVLGHGRFNSWMSQASRFTNIPAGWLAGLLRIMKGESGGNPNAVNRSDSNARAGHPSQGLMQLIPSTFAHYVPAKIRGWGIRNPVANIAAAVNYIRSKYGTPYNTPWYHGQTYYAAGGKVKGPLLRDNGGVLPPGDWMVQNHTGKNEYISRDSSEYKELHVHVADKHFVAQIDDRIAKHDDDMIKYIITRHH